MIYIRRVRTDAPGTRPRHITHVQYSFSPAGRLRVTTNRQIVRNLDAGHRYLVHDDDSGSQAEVITGTCAAGHRYITTVAEGLETNDLLSLPRF